MTDSDPQFSLQEAWAALMFLEENNRFLEGIPESHKGIIEKALQAEGLDESVFDPEERGSIEAGKSRVVKAFERAKSLVEPVAVPGKTQRDGFGLVPVNE